MVVFVHLFLPAWLLDDPIFDAVVIGVRLSFFSAASERTVVRQSFEVR